MRCSRILSLMIVLLLLISSSVSAFAAGPVAEAKAGTVAVFTNHGMWRSQGSGFFIGKRGSSVQYIVTNHHVVEDSDDGKAYIVLNDYDNPTPATILYRAPDVDMAILKLEKPTNLRSALPLKPIDYIEETDVVYISGFPGTSKDELATYTEDDITITQGTVTRKKASVYTGNSYSNGICFQTDGAVNHGNSGGPVLTEDGYVVGIATARQDFDHNGELAQGTNYVLYIDYAIEYFEKNGIPFEIYNNKGSNAAPTITATGAQVETIATFCTVAVATAAISFFKKKGRSKTGKKADDDVIRGEVVTPGGAGTVTSGSHSPEGEKAVSVFTTIKKPDKLPVEPDPVPSVIIHSSGFKEAGIKKESALPSGFTPLHELKPVRKTKED